MKNAVIVCGLQRAYFHSKGVQYLGERAEILKVRLLAYFKNLNTKDHVVFCLREVHQSNDAFFQGTKSYALVGTEDIELMEMFKPFIKFTVNTCRYSGFHKTALESELQKVRPQKVFVVGVQTHTNILFTCEELRNRDYDVTVYEPLTTAEDDFLHATGVNMLSNALAVHVE